MHYDNSLALEYLRKGCGDPRAQFRAGQQEAIQHLVAGDGRLLVVEKTGWGKSFVYFIATRLLRDQGYGWAILVSPLLALMRNQIQAARRMGVRAESINSQNPEDHDRVLECLQRGEVDILLVSPERLANAWFTEHVLAPHGDKVSLLIIDEAHCVSDWGHDFRPHYRLVERIIRRLPANMRVLGTTATANDRVMEDLTTVFGQGVKVQRGDLARPSLTLETLKLPLKAQRLAWLSDHLSKLPGSGIIYVLTKRDAYHVAGWLRSRGILAEAYASDSPDRTEREDALLNNEIKVLVATTALSMGFDKPDLGFVIHYQRPGSVVGYYQQVGRAGRSLETARGILLGGEEDDGIAESFISGAFPTRTEASLILDALEGAPDGLSIPQVQSAVNVRRLRIEHTLQLLSLEDPAPIVKVKSKYQLTTTPISEAFWDRTERLTAIRHKELEEMCSYMAVPFGEHMSYLVRALDGNPSQIEAPRLSPLGHAVNPETLAAATAFLQGNFLEIPPRKQWPQGGLEGTPLKGSIPPNQQCQEGRTLAQWNDGGWGNQVRSGKYRDKRFSDDLVRASLKLLRKWQPQPSPTWVTCIPSRRHPNLVPDFAKRLADALGLPFQMALAKTDDRPEQKAMANSYMQAANVAGSLQVDPSQVSGGPVLLIDDVVDSRWTLTIAGSLLQQAGSGPVWPMTLANTSNDSQD